MITIAVTGGMGAGKSETVNMMFRLGAAPVYADELSHATYAIRGPVFEALLTTFGDSILSSQGEVDRKRLARIVFGDPAKRKALESIVWPESIKLVQQALESNRAAGAEVSVFEAAVLFEAGWDIIADAIWTVEAPYHQRLERVARRTGMHTEAIRKRFQSQLSPSERMRQADETICNSSDLAALERRINELWIRATPKQPYR